MTTIVSTSGSNWATLVSDRGITGDLVMPDMPKIIMQGKWVIGVAGDIRACDLLQYVVKYPVIPQRLLTKPKSEWLAFIVSNVVPRMRQAIKGETEQDFEAILVTYGKSFLITSDFGVLDAQPYWAIGTGAKLAIGHLASAQYNDDWNKNHDLSAKQAISIASMHDPNTRGSVDVYISHHTGKAYRA